MNRETYRASPRDFRDVELHPAELPWAELLQVLRNAGYHVLKWGEVPEWFEEEEVAASIWAYVNLGGTQPRLPL